MEKRDRVRIPLPSEQLIAELHRLGVNFVSSQSGWVQKEAVEPTSLLANLALNPEARVRMAIIPLLLIHPSISIYERHASMLLAEHQQARQTLQLFYTAAALLQSKYWADLVTLVTDHTRLPELFTNELQLRPDPEIPPMLIRLGHRHSELMKFSADWANMYDHVAQRCIARLRKERQWKQQLAPSHR